MKLSNVIQSNIIDPIRDELDQRVFSGIDPRPQKIKFIRENFIEGMKSLVPDPNIYFDLYLTGSLTTYQYSDNSDCDISLFPHYEKLVALLNLPDANAVRKLLVNQVISHIDGPILPGTQHPIQNFVVLIDNKPGDLYQTGIRSAWSFSTESWFVPPEKDRVHSVKRELPLIYLRAHAIADKMRVALDTNPLAAKRLFERVHIKRTQDQRAGRGDFSEGNVVYKYLLHEGLFDRLREIGIYIAKVADFSTPLENPVNYHFIPFTPPELAWWKSLSNNEKQKWQSKAGWQNKRANELGVPGQLSGEDIAMIYHRYNGDCAYCGMPGASTLDHVIPLSKQGTNTVNNILPCHLNCNKELNVWDQKIDPLPRQIFLSPKWLTVPAEAKVSAHEDTQIIYDFIKDRIILGTKSEASIPSGVLIGTYRDGHATMYEAAHQWMNTTYFKKLWYHSFPTWPLNGISFSGQKGLERIAEEQPDVQYQQAFIYFGKPMNGLATKPTATEHSKLWEDTIDDVIERSTQNGEDPAKVENWVMDMMANSPKTAGHIGRADFENREQWYAVFFSDFMGDILTRELKALALLEIDKAGFVGIQEGPQWVYDQYWYKNGW